MTPIQTDGASETTAFETESDVANAFLAQFPDQDEDASKKKPSEKGETEDENVADEQETDAEASDESPEDDSEGEGSKTEEKKKSYVDNDETYVKLKVGDEELEVPVKDLKRLYGQEAALTRKGQEVAAQRAAADTEAQKYATSLNVLLERAAEKAKPYRELDWMALAKNPDISAEEASALRAEAQRVFEEETFLKSELGNYMAAQADRVRETLVTQAKACVQALSTPGTDEKPNPHYIDGWNPKVYDDLRAFGIQQGLHAEMVNNLVDPAAFKLIHMAMQYQRGTAKVHVEKVNKAPKKIVKTSSSPAANRVPASAAKKTEAMKAQRSNGNLENTANAFLSRLTAESED
jgi:hypothetical protein